MHDDLKILPVDQRAPNCWAMALFDSAKTRAGRQRGCESIICQAESFPRVAAHKNALEQIE